MNAYALLACAIALEVLATSLLKASDGMSRLWPTIGALAGYSVCFWLLALVMKTIPTGIAYAITAGEADNDTGAVAAGDVKLHLTYI